MSQNCNARFNGGGSLRPGGRGTDAGKGELGLERGPNIRRPPVAANDSSSWATRSGYHLAVVEPRTRSGRLRSWESLGLGVRSRCDGAGIAERSRPFQALRSTTGQPHSTAGVPRSAGRVGTPRGGQCVCTTGAHSQTHRMGLWCVTPTDLRRRCSFTATARCTSRDGGNRPDRPL